MKIKTEINDGLQATFSNEGFEPPEFLSIIIQDKDKTLEAIVGVEELFHIADFFNKISSINIIDSQDAN